MSTLKEEINKKFKEVLNQSGMMEQIESLRKEIDESGISSFAELNGELKEKLLQLKEETESKFEETLKSLGLHIKPPPYKYAKNRFDQLNEEIRLVIEAMIDSSNSKNKIEELKSEAAKAVNAPDSESKSKIPVLKQQIRQSITETISSSGLKDKYVKLMAEISEIVKSPEGVDGKSIGGNEKEANSR